jgi:hypothetical protein
LNLIEISIGKGNFPSHLLGNSIEILFKKTEENFARLEVIGESMNGISELQPGAQVPLKLLPIGTEYKKGDIIVFYDKEDIKIVHQVEYVYEYKGKKFYVTQGVNERTNRYVDSTTVSEDYIIGQVELSKEAFIALDEMLENRDIPSIKAYAKPEKYRPITPKVLDNTFKRMNNLAKLRGLRLVSFNNHDKDLTIKELEEACNKARKLGKGNNDATLLWKHEECSHVWENSYSNIKQNLGTCPKCEGSYTNQILTNDICENLFKELGYIKENTLYQREYSLKKIFPNLKVHHAVHLDGYVELNIKDKNGNYIKIALEYQGRQHDEKKSIGFETYKFLTHNLEIKENTQEYEDLLDEWNDQISRDQFKVDHFKSKNKNGYYLIVINYDVKPEARQADIIRKFKDQTGIDLSNILK